jgi:hypothetical protein
MAGWAIVRHFVDVRKVDAQRSAQSGASCIYLSRRIH